MTIRLGTWRRLVSALLFGLVAVAALLALYARATVLGPLQPAADPPVPTSLAVVGSATVSLTVGGNTALTVQVQDEQGIAFTAGTQVRFSSTAVTGPDAANPPAAVAGGTLGTVARVPPANPNPNEVTVTSDAAGNASAVLTATTRAGGPYMVTATLLANNATATFSVTNTVGAAIVTADNGTISLTAQSSTAVSATVKDSFGNLISGAQVRFSAPAVTNPDQVNPPSPTAGGTLGTAARVPPANPNPNEVTVTSDAAGHASAVLTATTRAGGPYTVTATVVANNATATFSVTNTPGPAVVTVDNDTISLTAKASTNVGATVKDSFGNLISGAQVRFSAPAVTNPDQVNPPSPTAGGTLGTAARVPPANPNPNEVTVTSDAAGHASAVLTATTRAGGPYTVTATALSNNASASIGVTNLAGPASAIAVDDDTISLAAKAFTSVGATVTDSFGNLIGGTQVRFSTPAVLSPDQANPPSPTAGATLGTVARSPAAPGGASVTVTTDSAGHATAVLTAATRAGGPYTVTATLLINNAVSSITVFTTAGPAAVLTLDATTLNLTVPGSSAIGASVRDAFGNIVNNGQIRFSTAAVTNPDQANPPSPTAGATLGTVARSAAAPGDSSITVATNSVGRAGAVATATTRAGTYTITAAAVDDTGAVLVSADIAVTNRPAAPAQVIATTATVSLEVSTSTSLQVTVQDGFGNPIPDPQTVRFTTAAATVPPVAAGTVGGSTTVSVTSNASGSASTTLATNTVAGSYTVSARLIIGGVPSGTGATFSITNLPGPPARLAGPGATPVHVTVDASVTLTVTVQDAFGNTVTTSPSVRFSAPSTAGAPGGSFGGAASVTVTADSSARASTSLTANTVAGSYTVTAQLLGPGDVNVGTPVSISMVNDPGPAARVTVASTSLTLTVSGTATLVAVARDSFGNAVTSQPSVHFHTAAVTQPDATNPPSPTAGGTLGTSVRDGARPGGPDLTVMAATTGNASAVLTATTKAGTYEVTAALVDGSQQDIPSSLVTISVTNEAGQPVKLIPIAPTQSSTAGQLTTTLNAPFESMIVQVQDIAGNPVTSGSHVPAGGFSVTFAAPAAGVGVATGTFADTNGQQTTVQLMPNGTNQAKATAPAFTANSRGGDYLVTVTSVIPAAAGPPPTPETTLTTSFAMQQVSAQFVVTLGTASQQAPVLTTFPAIVATVQNSSGVSISGAIVTVTATSSSAAGVVFPDGGTTSAVMTTDATGTASMLVQANAHPGLVTLTANTPNAPETTLQLQNTIGPAAQLLINAGNNQEVSGGTNFAPLQVLVTDAGGNPVAGVDVTFTAPPASISNPIATCSFLRNVGTSDGNGVATSGVCIPQCPQGLFLVEATAAENDRQLTGATFSLRSNAATVHSLVPSQTSAAQSAGIGTVYAVPLRVTALDAAGKPVAGANVDFTLPTTGPSGTFPTGNQATITTDCGGVAIAPAPTANSTAGQFVATATTPGDGPGGVVPTTFALSNTAGIPASIVAISGTPQSAASGTAFAPLVVTVRDANNNPLAGVAVNFSAPSSGPSGLFPGNLNVGQATTGDNGQAAAPPLTANAAPGPFNLIASIGGGINPAVFSLTVTDAGVGGGGGGGGGGPGSDGGGVPVGVPKPPDSFAGYWMVAADGRVFGFGASFHAGEPSESIVPQMGAGVRAVQLVGTKSGRGYWVLDNRGRVYAYGDARSLGNADATGFGAGETAITMSVTPSQLGYWIFTTAGRVITFGDARSFGDLLRLRLNGGIINSVATPSGHGYYLVGADGGVFAFGDAGFAGSMGGRRLNKPVVGLVPNPNGLGYWLVASDGGVFAFGVPFRGSLGSVVLNRPVVGMVSYGDGYLMVGADGGIFDFSSLPFLGSLGSTPPNQPVVAVAGVVVRLT